MRDGSEQLLAKIYLEHGLNKIPKAYLQKVLGESGNHGNKDQKFYKGTAGNSSRINNSLMI